VAESIIVNSPDEAISLANEYLTEHPTLSMEIKSVQKSSEWIDGHRIINAPVYIVNCNNLKENPMEGGHFLSIVIGIYSGKIEDVAAH